MVAPNYTTIRHKGMQFSCADACRLAQRVAEVRSPVLVFIWLEQTTETTTPALTRLVLLRRDLLKEDRDLRLIGLNGRAKGLYEVNRLAEILPTTCHVL